MNLSPLPIQKFFDNAGRPLSGGLLFTYVTSTTTKLATYQNQAGTPNTNPVVLDFRGEANVWLDQTLTYTFVLAPSTDTDPPTNPIWSVDDIQAPASLANFTQAALGAILWPPTPAEIAAGVLAFIDFAYEPLDPLRYGVVGDGVANDTAAWARWRSVVNLIATSGPFHNYGIRIDPTCQAGHPTALENVQLGAIENVAYGQFAGQQITTGIANTFLGYSCAPLMTAGDFTTAVGANSLLFYTSGLGFNTAIGYGAMARNLTTFSSVAVGFEAMHDNGAGGVNVAIGPGALRSGTNGVSPTPFDPSNCVAIGRNCLLSNYAIELTAVGTQAMELNTSGTGNTAMGFTALQQNTTGTNNTVMGYQAGLSATVGDHSTCVGFQAGLSQTTSAGFNTFIGSLAGFFDTTGTQNVAVGYQALQGTSGSNGKGGNVAIGFASMANCTLPSSCVAVGQLSLKVATSASHVIAVGENAFVNLTSGSHNTGVGDNAGATLTTGSNNVCVGDSTDVSAAAATNQNSFGYQAACSGDNQITLGNPSIATIRAQVTTITAISDARFKKSIKSLYFPDEFFEELHIVTFEWSVAGMPEGPIVGVIAQELDELQKKYDMEWLGLVDKTNPDRWEATPGKILFLMTVYVQRQAKALSALAKRVAALEGDNQWRAAH